MNENTTEELAEDESDRKGTSPLEEALDEVNEVNQTSKFAAELELANERVLRAQADLENFRKRMRRDYEDQLKYANLPLLADMLGVLDNLRRAMASTAEAGPAAGLRSGVEMVIKQFETVLEKHHCKPIPSVGEPFDPHYHEAISQMPHEEITAGFVALEAVVGYQLGDRVIRPSQVIVSSGPASK
jgi:molecular chaperone GrpE